LPRPPSIEVEEDVGDDLVRQLLAYKQFKQVAQGLGQREAEGLRSFIRLAPLPKIEVTHVDLTGITVEDLLTAVRRALAVAGPLPPVGNVVKPLTITIRDQIALIERMLKVQPQISFMQLLQRRSRVEIAVTFLAVLELLKWRRIEVLQEQLFGEIVIQRGAEVTDATPLLMDDAEFGEEENGEEP
jgi:segregation and condensation protein A